MISYFGFFAFLFYLFFTYILLQDCTKTYTNYVNKKIRGIFVNRYTCTNL